MTYWHSGCCYRTAIRSQLKRAVITSSALKNSQVIVVKRAISQNSERLSMKKCMIGEFANLTWVPSVGVFLIAIKNKLTNSIIKKLLRMEQRNNDWLLIFELTPAGARLIGQA